MSYIPHCNTCGLLDPTQSVCRLTKLKKDPLTDFCNKHRKEVHRCEICGSITLNPIIDVSEMNIHILCHKCAQQRSTCTYCKNNNECAFDNDPSPTPKVILQTVNQDNMYIQTQVLNPERIRETCAKKCFCFDAENGCLRQNNYCGNHHFTWERTSNG